MRLSILLRAWLRSLCLLLCFAVATAAHAQTAEGLVPDSTELRVLRQFYYATGGPQWTNQHGWLQGTTLAQAAGWGGLAVENGDVVRLHLGPTNLTGSIPACVGELRALRELVLWQNLLTGPLPVELGQLTHLRTLGLMQNQLSGPIPAALGQLTQLQVLNLHSNQFSGPLPAALRPLTALREVDLTINQLSGPLPAWLGEWTQLTAFGAAVNQFTGPLPASLGQLTQLENLQLWQNNFQDSIPAAWGGLRRLQRLNLAQSQLIGPVPASLGQLTELRAINLYANALTGPLPAALAGWHQVQSVHLEVNQFTGSLPASFSQWQQVQEIALHVNQLTGPLPARWGRLAQLTFLNLAGNQLSGPLPDSLGALARLVTLQLSSNRFSGPVPAAWGQLGALRELLLANNELTGPLPAELGHLPALRHLWLPGNRLTGSLPAAWSGLTQVESLLLNTNALTGTIPASWKQLARLQELRLQGNRLSGSLPDSLGVGMLDVSDNRLTGTVPAFYAHSPRVHTLWVGTNELTDLPDFRQHPLGARFELRAWVNRLDFGALERNLTAPNQSPFTFYFEGQRTRQPQDIVQVVVGQPLRLQRGMRGAHNHYQWERQVGQAWVPIPGATDTTYVAGLASEASEGHYRVAVTNDWVAATTLYTRTQYVTLLPYAALALNEPDDNCVFPVADTPPTDRTGARDSVNYVRTYSARAAFTDPDSLKAAAVGRVQVTTQYLDGLGRPVQTVQRAASPSGRDLVQLTEYDALGRQPRQYLPYSAAPATADAVGYYPNARREQHQFYQGTGPAAALTQHLPKTNVAFAATSFEASPLNRPLAQASPGESWQLSSNHAVTLDERPNTAADSVQRWEPGYGANREDLLPQGAYAAGELWGKQTRDEQGQWLQEFTDKEGRVVLKQVGLDGDYNQVASQWLKTYYVYDDFGRLRAVVPPKAVQRLRKNPTRAWAVDGAGVELLLFRYHYDEQGRLVEKKVPDQAGYSYTLYNELDQPILTQDVAQQTNKEWVNTKYDALGRVAYTALVRFADLTGTPSQQVDQLQGWYTNWLAQHAGVPLWEEASASPVLGRARYTHHTWPDMSGVAGTQLLAVSDYDDYDFDRNGPADVQYQAPTAAELACAASEVPQVDLRVTGQATRTQVRVLGVAESEPGAWLTSVSFFDEKLRPIQVQSSNARGGTDVVTTRYDFAGKALSSYAVHQVPNQTPHTVREQSAYDHAGRLLSVTQELNGATPQVIARHRYNELGQLEQKQLGGNLTATAGQAVTPPLPGTGPAALQTVDYRYNIRGWLTKINDVANPDPQDLWSFSLHYDCGFQEKQFNGNIAGQTWRSASDGIERAYGYRYDQASRLLQGDFVARATSSPTSAWGAERGNYRFSFASYDAGGNLVTLRRRGLVAAATRTSPAQYAETDNLRYRYTPAAGSAEPESNRLQRVDDLAPATTSFGGKLPERPDFSDGTTAGASTPDYTYDAVGSLLSDRNKGITRIQYNYLHLPELIEWQNGNTLQYRYTATGQKVTKLATEAGKAVVRTDYLGAWQYERDSLRWLSHAEGRALYLYSRDNANQVLTKVQYEYTLKDHLGNLRVAFHPGETRKYEAMLDSDPVTTAREQHTFDYESVSAPIRQIVGQQFAHGGDGVALLNASGAQPQPLGPLKQLAVARRDTVLVTAFGMYQQKVRSNSTWGFSLASFVASLLQQPPPAPTPTAEGTRRVRVLPLLSAGLTAATLPALSQLADGVPKAYLRILVFNSDSVLVRTKTKQLTLLAEGGYERLRDSVVVPQAGYVQAYVANESDTDVFFDDITVEHRQGLQVQENQYDPYGLDLAGLSKAATPQNQYTWNGKEKQTEFGLNWHDHGWRFYDPTLGRWVVSDPDAEEGDQEGWGTYQFGLDNAVRYNDLDGRVPGGPSREQVSMAVHTTLDLVGLIPGAGEIADGANALMYLAEGNKVDAALSVAAMVPLAGMAATGAKFARKAEHLVSAARTADKLNDARKVGDKAGDAARAVKKACGCFTAGTGVSTRLGRKPIEKIQVGDSVWAYNERTRQTALRPVTHLFRYERDTVYVLHTATGEVLRTTSDHPFYVRGQWVRVKRLRVGDSLVSQSGQRHVLRRIDLQPEHVTVYNFTVNELHTYFVGQSAILVHNSGPCDLAERAKAIQDAQPAGKARNMSTTAIGDVINPDGTKSRVVASSRKYLSRAQQAAMKPGEVAAKGAGHAETTILNHAAANGQTVTKVAASRPICHSCQEALKNASVQPASSLK